MDKEKSKDNTGGNPEAVLVPEITHLGWVPVPAKRLRRWLAGQLGHLKVKVAEELLHDKEKLITIFIPADWNKAAPQGVTYSADNLPIDLEVECCAFNYHTFEFVVKIKCDSFDPRGGTYGDDLIYCMAR